MNGTKYIFNMEGIDLSLSQVKYETSEKGLKVDSAMLGKGN